MNSIVFITDDIKTTAAQHYRRVVISEKIRKNKDAQKNIQYQDALNSGKTGQFDLGRAPRGVNDGNGILFISHIGDVFPSGLLPIKAGNVREKLFSDIYRHSQFLKN